jgi:hypothetical protein
MSNETSGKPASVSVNITSHLKVTATNFTFNRISRTYKSTVMVENISQQSVAGLCIWCLPISHADEPAGTTVGSPYIRVTNNTLAAGHSSSLRIRVQAPPASAITFTPWSIPGVLREP